MATLIKRVRIIDPKNDLDIKDDIYIDAYEIKIAPSTLKGSYVVLNGRNLLAVPGLIDLGIDFGNFGFAKKEDVPTGIRDAWAGGVTSAMMMPNAFFSANDMRRAFYQKKLASLLGFDLKIAALATKGVNREELADIGFLKRLGAKAFSDNVQAIKEPQIETLLKQCRLHDVLFMQHAAKSSEIARNILRAFSIGSRYHVLNLSSKTSLALLERAKRNGVNISANICPLELLLVPSPADQEALCLGIKSGVIDAVASNYMAHMKDENAHNINATSFGLKNSIVALLTLVKESKITLNRAIALMTSGPARILKEEDRIGTLVDPALLNMCLLDPNYRRTIRTKNLHGRLKNSAFIGREVFGRVIATFQNGRLVYRA